MAIVFATVTVCAASSQLPIPEEYHPTESTEKHCISLEIERGAVGGDIYMYDVALERTGVFRLYPPPPTRRSVIGRPVPAACCGPEAHSTRPAPAGIRAVVVQTFLWEGVGGL